MFKKIRNKVNSMVATAKSTVTTKKAEGYVDSGVKILIAVVIGALLLAGLYALFNTTIMLSVMTNTANRMKYRVNCSKTLLSFAGITA